MNKKRILAGALVLAASALAHADPITWKFEFIGMPVTTWSYWEGVDGTSFTGTLTGFIEAEDRNRDSLIDKSELISLTIGDHRVSGNFAICDAGPRHPDHFCALERFVFAPDTPLGPTLDIAGYWEVVEMPPSWRRMEITTGDYYEYDIYKENGRRYRWTDETTLSVTQVSPVPEPASGLMLGAGLLVAVVTRRLRGRRRKTAPALAL